jgi:Flp pilus assembly protein TadG
MKHRRSREAGSVVIEFAIIGPVLMLITITLFQIALAMWNYETLAFAVREGARYCSVHGQGCGYSNNSCSITVSNVAYDIATAAVGLAPGTMNVTLTPSRGTSINCNPLNSCYSNSTAWPPSSANTEGSSSVTVTGYYPLNLFFMPRQGFLGTSTGNLQASSQQIIQF